jgi:16S rRNA processing protein RimM
VLNTAPDLIALGVVAGAHGVGGELRVFPFNPESENLAIAKSVWLRDPQGSVSERRVLHQRRHKQYFLLEVDGIGDRGRAEALRGCEVLVPRNDLQELPPDELYYDELIGMSVLSEDGRPLGRVEEVFETGSNAVAIVRQGKAEVLVPWIEDAIVTIDRQERHIIVREAFVP